MVMEEIYLLTKHARFNAEYIEDIPVYKRRFHLNLLLEELEQTKAAQDKAISKSKQK
jgi:hypothetical protein